MTYTKTVNAPGIPLLLCKGHISGGFEHFEMVKFSVCENNKI